MKMVKLRFDSFNFNQFWQGAWKCDIYESGIVTSYGSRPRELCTEAALADAREACLEELETNQDL